MATQRVRVGTNDDPAAALAARLRAARARLGLTVRAMGDATGIPWTTIAALETGREPKWSTLMRYLEHVPGLRAAELLPPLHPVPPASSRSVHEFILWAYGYRARRVGLQVTLLPDGTARREVSIEGVRWTAAPGPRQVILPRLLQACAAGSDVVLRQLVSPPLDRKELRLEDGPTRWTFRIVGTADAPEVSCRIVGPADDDATEARIALAIPAESLDLSLRLRRPPGSGAARVVIVPTARAAQGATADIAAFLHPRGVDISTSSDGLRVTASPAEPMPDLTYALRWDDAAPAAERGAKDPPTLARIATSLREGAGLSTRELARRMGVSHGTVLAAERSRDARAGTLRAYMTALPSAAPQALLPASSPASPSSSAEAWEWYREAHLLEIERLEQVTVVAADGTRRTTTRFVGVRSLDPAERAVNLVLGMGMSAFAKHACVLESIATEAAEDADAVRVRRYERSEGGVSWAVTIPGRRSRRGLTFEQTRTNPGRFLLSLEAAFAKYGSADPDVVIGGSCMVHLPVRRLSHELRLPSNARVRAPFVACHPPLAPGHLDLGWLERLHGGVWRAVADVARGRFRLEVERPACGFAYGYGVFLA